ncbi:DUF883 family protein [Phaeovulum sp.]|uniref:DUF883 family protein n=1 Tax=Phaeovulum sp. TaxID=2934796 RepID=UPI0039E4D455
MATAGAESKPDTQADFSAYEEEIRADMADIRKDIAALTKTLGKYGKARADGLQIDASDFTEEMLTESRRAVKKLSKQVAKLEKNMKANVQENPLQWFLGALGLGLVIAMLVRRNHD